MEPLIHLGLLISFLNGRDFSLNRWHNASGFFYITKNYVMQHGFYMNQECLNNQYHSLLRFGPRKLSIICWLKNHQI